LENLRTSSSGAKIATKKSPRKKSQIYRRPIIKLEMNLEEQSISVVKAPTKQNNKVEKSLLRRSLSHSARVLTSKAQQIKLSEVVQSQTFEAFQHKLLMRSPQVKVVELKI
jgi:hypothetical protein